MRHVPRQLYGTDTYSYQSRFMVETLIKEVAEVEPDTAPIVLERVRDEFITRLYGPGTAQDQPRALLRLSIHELEALMKVALDVCSDHPDDPDAAQNAVIERLQRKWPGPTIFGLVDGSPLEALARTSLCGDVRCSPILRRV